MSLRRISAGRLAMVTKRMSLKREMAETIPSKQLTRRMVPRFPLQARLSYPLTGGLLRKTVLSLFRCLALTHGPPTYLDWERLRNPKRKCPKSVKREASAALAEVATFISFTFDQLALRYPQWTRPLKCALYNPGRTGRHLSISAVETYALYIAILTAEWGAPCTDHLSRLRRGEITPFQIAAMKTAVPPLELRTVYNRRLLYLLSRRQQVQISWWLGNTKQT